MKQNLVRIVEMGPWKHRVDDGLEARKTAYETMYTLVSAVFVSEPGLSDPRIK
jgi:TATA-binding protein interacting (TIP20)